MDQDLINRLARKVLAKYRLGADFKAALAEAARSYLAQYKGRTFGQVMGAIAKATKLEEVRWDSSWRSNGCCSVPSSRGN